MQKDLKLILAEDEFLTSSQGNVPEGMSAITYTVFLSEKNNNNNNPFPHKAYEMPIFFIAHARVLNGQFLLEKTPLGWYGFDGAEDHKFETFGIEKREDVLFARAMLYRQAKAVAEKLHGITGYDVAEYFRLKPARPGEIDSEDKPVEAKKD